jgi:26S proteasome regulatory subunit N9
MSSYIDPIAPSLESLSNLAQEHPDQSSTYNEFSNLLSSKLYHQLIVAIHTFIQEPSNARTEPSSNLFTLYSDVLTPIAAKLNPLTLARIACHVAFSLNDYEAAKTLLEELVQELEKKDETQTLTTRLYTESKKYFLTLKQMEHASTTTTSTSSALESIKSFLNSNKTRLTELANSTESDVAIVHSAFYQCAMTYRKAVGPPEAFYKEAISYLHYTPLESITPPSEQYKIATDLSLSALTGDGVYNFGEVVHNNSMILKVLQGTENEYLVKLMKASADGDVMALEQISNEHGAAIGKEPALINRANVIKEKITLLALVKMVFERPSNERTLSFEDIATQTKMPVDKVEWIIMRALSLGLIKGSMDQVEQTVDVTWVMPRVLDEEHMRQLALRFGEWSVEVNKTKEYMDERIPVTFG